MIVERLVVGPLQTNCYIAACEKTLDAAVIDPGFDGQGIVAQAHKMGVRIVAILDTHAHGDHVMDNDLVRDETGAKVMVHEDDAPALAGAGEHLSALLERAVALKPADRLLKDGSIVDVGELRLETLHTPGHSPGSCCFLCEDVLFSGDTLFAGSAGRTDFPGGSRASLIASIAQKLMPLADDTRVLPGHGPETAIGVERASNPFTRGRLV
ncbi:MAG: MBL fold metallo-hydrolase [Bacillota bacterium]|nr:MBL fold metallo-hydrolase [Bacillota bacterium]